MLNKIKFQTHRLNDVRRNRIDLLRISKDQRMLAEKIDDAGDSFRVVMDKLRRFG